MACVLEQCPILYRSELRPGVVDMVLGAPRIAPLCSPGQFVHIKCSPDLLLRRPISLCAVEQDTIRLVLESVGKGSQWLCERQAGELLDLLGPLGDHGFPVPDAAQGDSRPLLLVGGGVGSAPLLYCAKSSPVPVDAALGFGSAGAVILERDFARCCRSVTVSTDDGSYGFAGFVTGAAQQLLEKEDYRAVYACGNMTMLRAVAELTQRLDVPCYLSLDERMGCGLGACLVCAVKVRGEDGEHYSHVCKQGPVYRREEVVFE